MSQQPARQQATATQGGGHTSVTPHRYARNKNWPLLRATHRIWHFNGGGRGHHHQPRGLSAGGQMLFGKGLEKGNIQNVLIDGYLWKHRRRIFFFFARIIFCGQPFRKAGTVAALSIFRSIIVPIVCESEWDKSFFVYSATGLLSREAFQGNNSR